VIEKVFDVFVAVTRQFHFVGMWPSEKEETKKKAIYPFPNKWMNPQKHPKWLAGFLKIIFA